MIDDGDGEISVEEFIDGATRLRGMARSLDVAQVLTSIRKLELKIEDIKTFFSCPRKRREGSRLSSPISTRHPERILQEYVAYIYMFGAALPSTPPPPHGTLQCICSMAPAGGGVGGFSAHDTRALFND